MGRVQRSGFWVQGLGLGIWGESFFLRAYGASNWGSGVRVCHSGYRDSRVTLLARCVS